MVYLVMTQYKGIKLLWSIPWCLFSHLSFEQAAQMDHLRGDPLNICDSLKTSIGTKWPIKKKENLNWITSFIICCTQHTLQDSLLFNLFPSLSHTGSRHWYRRTGMFPHWQAGGTCLCLPVFEGKKLTMDKVME